MWRLEAFCGAYKGRLDVIVPFLGQKNSTLTHHQKSHHEVEQLF